MPEDVAIGKSTGDVASSSAKSLFSFANCTKLYGTVIGVNDISLEIAPGAYGLLGPNGSGKTTFLNLLTGQIRPTLGSVDLFGVSPWRHEGVRGRVGLCPASELLHRGTSALQWVQYLAELQGFTRAEAAERAAEALRKVGMQHAMHRPIGSFSRGMKQRTKLAQAIAHEPEFLILDEPFNGLDPVGRHELSELLVTWIQGGRSVLLASHVLHEVESISTSFMLICGGRLLASGSAQEVHSLLAGIPADVRIHCRPANRLAQVALQDDTVQSIHIDAAADSLVISSRNPLQIYQNLPQWSAAHDVEIFGIESAEESLQSLFSSLMKIHRGEGS